MGVNALVFHPYAHGGSPVIQGRFPGGRPTLIQPKPASSGHPVAAYVEEAIHRGASEFYRLVAQRKAVQEAHRQASTAQRCRAGNATLLPATFRFAPSIGAPMPPVVQRKMEAFFEADFSDVRVHVGPQAQQIGAEAFTRGSDIYFAPGRYLPHHSHGQRLLGHELAHVVQQRAGRVRNPFGSGIAVVRDPGLEAEADRMGMQAAVHQVETWAKPTPQVQAKVATKAASENRFENGPSYAPQTNVAQRMDFLEKKSGEQTTYAMGATYDVGTSSIGEKTPIVCSGNDTHAEGKALPLLTEFYNKGERVFQLDVTRSPCTSTERHGLPKTRDDGTGCTEAIIEWKEQHPDAELTVLSDHLYGGPDNTTKGRAASILALLAMNEKEVRAVTLNPWWKSERDVVVGAINDRELDKIVSTYSLFAQEIVRARNAKRYRIVKI